MAMNWVQFQQGMSIPEFLSAFGTEAQCVRAVKQARWPSGFCCPRYLNLNRLAGLTCQAVRQWASANLKPGSSVTSDGLACFAAVMDAGRNHVPFVVGRRKLRELPNFKWVNTILGNLKTALSGAYKAFKYGKYADSYLGAFAYRFNRRFDLRGLVARLIVDVTQCHPRSRSVIRQAETHF